MLAQSLTNGDILNCHRFIGGLMPSVTVLRKNTGIGAAQQTQTDSQRLYRLGKLLYTAVFQPP